MNKFTIVIPIFNEELNIKNLIEEIFQYLTEYENKFDIILINDASTDDSLKEINKLVNEYPKIIKLIDNKNNLGQSYSLIEGIKSSVNKTIVTLDGDGQNHPKDIPILLKKYFFNSDLFLVGGIRLIRKDSFVKIISSKIANSLRSKILMDGCPDTGCSLKVFDKDVFMNFPFFKGIHRFLPALYKGFGKDTFFINVSHRYRLYGKSKYGTFGRLFNGIRDLIKVAKIIRNFKKITIK